MVSDIKLDGEWLVVEGNFMRVRTLDLMLDAPARRQNQQGWRRALVHNQQDGLTINYAGDYPGGVMIQGQIVRMHDVKMTGALRAASVHVNGSLATGGMLEAGTGLMVHGRVLVHVEAAGTNAEAIVLGEPNATNAITVEGRGMQINGGLQVRGKALFDQPPRVSDVILGGWPPPTGISIVSHEESLTKIIAGLRAEIEHLKARIAALEGTA